MNLVEYQRPWKTAYTQEWNASVEYQLTPSQTVTVAYVGNNTHHLLNGDKRNIPSIILPPGTNQNLYIPFPDFARNSDYVAANGAAYYHSFALAFERRFSRGLNLLANYTHSECRTDNKNILGIADGNFARAPTLAGWGLEKDYQYCGNDVPNEVFPQFTALPRVNDFRADSTDRWTYKLRTELPALLGLPSRAVEIEVLRLLRRAEVTEAFRTRVALSFKYEA